MNAGASGVSGPWPGRWLKQTRPEEATPRLSGYALRMSLLAFLGPQELTLVVILALVVFGGSQLPKLARNLGRAQKELQKGMAEGAADADRAEGAADVDSTEDSSD